VRLAFAARPSEAIEMADATNSNGRWARRYPELGTAPLPIDPCVSPQYFELERERVFKHAWLNVGRIDEIPHPGDFFVRDLAVCKTSMLVARGWDGQVRSFLRGASAGSAHRAALASPVPFGSAQRDCPGSRPRLARRLSKITLLSPASWK
jgi:hypothetical protein